MFSKPLVVGKLEKFCSSLILKKSNTKAFAKVTSTSSLGTLCTWYSKSSESNVLTLSPHSTLQKERIEELRVDDTGEEIVVVEEVKEKKREDEKNVEEIIHCYIPISSYVCTLPHECFEKIEKDFVADKEGVNEHNDEALHLATASKLVLIVKQLQILNYSLRKEKQLN